jgi:hypothetical protein
MLVAIPGSGGHVGLAHFSLGLSSFVKDCGMAASWSTAIDIGHRYSRTVAGFMSTVGNLSQVIAVPVVAWLAMLAGSRGHPNWRVCLSFLRSHVLCGSAVLAVRRAAAAHYRLFCVRPRGQQLRVGREESASKETATPCSKITLRDESFSNLVARELPARRSVRS